MRYQIQKEDIGKSIIKIEGEAVYLNGLLGRIQPRDVGKRITYRPKENFLKVENDEQLAQAIREGRNIKSIQEEA